MVELFANSGDTDQIQHSTGSDLGLHCLPFILVGVSRLQWVKGSLPKSAVRLPNIAAWKSGLNNIHYHL